MDVTRSRISPSGIGFGVGNSLGAFGLAERVEFESDKLGISILIFITIENSQHVTVILPF